MGWEYQHDITGPAGGVGPRGAVGPIGPQGPREWQLLYDSLVNDGDADGVFVGSAGKRIGMSLNIVTTYDYIYFVAAATQGGGSNRRWGSTGIRTSSIGRTGQIIYLASGIRSTEDMTGRITSVSSTGFTISTGSNTTAWVRQIWGVTDPTGSISTNRPSP